MGSFRSGILSSLIWGRLRWTLTERGKLRNFFRPDLEVLIGHSAQKQSFIHSGLLTANKRLLILFITRPMAYSIHKVQSCNNVRPVFFLHCTLGDSWVEMKANWVDTHTHTLTDTQVGAECVDKVPKGRENLCDELSWQCIETGSGMQGWRVVVMEVVVVGVIHSLKNPVSDMHSRYQAFFS